MDPKISIITSLYKGKDFIKGFLEDIVNQTIFKEKCELIIIDANSPDKEKDIILEYQKNTLILFMRDWTRIPEFMLVGTLR